MATAISRSRVRPAAKNEWGVYDPQQAGFAALYARLDAKDPKAAPAPQAAPAPAADTTDVSRPRPARDTQ